MSHAATRIPIKVIVLISFLLSLVLLAVCSWTLAGIYHHPHAFDNWDNDYDALGQGQEKGKNQAGPWPRTGNGAPVNGRETETGNPQPRFPFAPSYNEPPPGAAPPETGPHDDASQPWLPNGRRGAAAPVGRNLDPTDNQESTTTVFFGRRRPTRGQTPEALNEPQQILPNLLHMEGDYKWLATGCLCGSMFAALIQCISSLFALCSYSKDISHRMKLWVILQFIVFLILVITILVPLTYDPVKQQHLKLDEILSQTQSRMVYSIFNNEKTIHEILLHDFNAYFIVTILNEGFLLLFMISVCCLVKCGQQTYEPIRNSRN